MLLKALLFNKTRAILKTYFKISNNFKVLEKFEKSLTQMFFKQII